MTANDTVEKTKKSRTLKILIGVVVLGLAGGAVAWREVRTGGDNTDKELATFTAKRGPLTISVLESGTIKARDQEILKSQVEGRTSIIFLIEEGTRVKKGEKLVELDTNTIQDNKIDQEIEVQNAEAAFISARENLAVTENQAKSDQDIAELDLRFAIQDLEKYIQGDFPNLETAAREQITLRKEELEVAKQRREWSEKLAAEKYISETERRDDELKYQRAMLNLKLAENDLELLRTYTYTRQMDQLKSDKNQAEMALERTKRKAFADVAQAQAELKAKEAELARRKDKLAKYERQIANAIIYAPSDGLVIYATTARRGGWRGGSQEPLDEGQEVHERQELIYLPVGDATKVEVDIHEASLKKLKLGLPAIITVDALPGRRFLGHLATIAPLPDSQSMWMNPDLKVYNTEVFVDDEDPALRSGMSCKVELIVSQYEDAVYIPIQAVMTEAGQPTVYVMEDGVPKPRPVKIGLDNNRMIRILEGIQEGEVVLLEPPLKAAAVDEIGVEDEPNATQDLGGDFQSRIRESLQKSRENPNTNFGAGTQRGPGQGQARPGVGARRGPGGQRPGGGGPGQGQRRPRRPGGGS